MGMTARKEPLVTTLLTYNLGVQAFEERDYKTAVERFSSVLVEDPRNLSVRSTWHGRTTIAPR